MPGIASIKSEGLGARAWMAGSHFAGERAPGAHFRLLIAGHESLPRSARDTLALTLSSFW